MLGELLVGIKFVRWLWPKAQRFVPPDLRSSILGRLGEGAVAEAVAEAGFPAMHDVLLPADDGGTTQIDHLVLLPVGIAVIETKNWSGDIYGGGKQRSWTVLIGKSRYRQQNPLRQNYRHERAVKALVPVWVEVFNHVVMTGTARFRRDRPDNVSSLEELADHLIACRGLPIHTDLRRVWVSLQAAAITDSDARARHLEDVRLRKRREPSIGAPGTSPVKTFFGMRREDQDSL